MNMKRSIAQMTPDDWFKLKMQLQEAAPSLGIDQLGFASADSFTTLKQRLIDHQKKGYASGFEEKDIEKRIHPELHLRAPQSILAIAIAYPSKLANPPQSMPGAYRGIIARSAWGEDYHRVLRQRIHNMRDWLEERIEDVSTEIMVDTGALVDRAVAERAGIGWSAKNCSIISPELGSWIYLGEMITNLPFSPDQPITDECGSCTLCIDACPTGALVGPGQLDATRCISFLTQTKGDVPDEIKRKIGNRLYGCDTCQVVCPKNKGKNWTQHAELQPDPELAKPLLLPLLEMSNRQFKETFGASAASWRGKTPIQRNAVIALGHFRDQSAVPLLGKLAAEDHRPAIRASAIWALARIGGDEAERFIQKCFPREFDESVLQAIHKALDANNRNEQ